MNEEMAILLAKEGHENGFKKLYEDYRERIYHLAYRYTRSRQEAEDILQETFIKAFRGIKTLRYENSRSFSAWLNRICINCSMTYLRKRKRRKMDQMISIKDLHNEPATQTLSAEESVHIKQVMLMIKEATQKLSAKQQVIFDLRFGQHWQIKDIAENMKCSESNIKTQIFRSLAKLRKQLGPIWEEL